MRGSAVPDLSVVSSLAASAPGLKENSDALALLRSNDAALLIKELDKSRLALDRGLNDLHLLVGGDYEMLLSTAQDAGIEGYGVESMREVINSFPDLVETVNFMSTMLQQEILPIVANTRKTLTKQLPESERHLAGLFEGHSRSDDETSQQDTTRSTSNGHTDESASSSTSHHEGFASAFEEEGKRKFMDEMVRREFPGMRDMLLVKNIRGGMNFPGHRSHRSHIRSKSDVVGQSTRRNRNRDARRLQQQDQTSDIDCSIDTCGLGYIEIVNATQRKRCNCKDLFECVSQLSYTDYAVIFSRGLVDEAAGVIDVPEADDEVSDLSALNDIYDAKNLLRKINRIQGFVMPGRQDCDSLLNEFHVPCTDWQFGCSESDGKSYRMVSFEVPAVRLFVFWFFWSQFVEVAATCSLLTHCSLLLSTPKCRTLMRFATRCMRASALHLHLFRRHSMKKRRSKTHAHLIKVSEGIASVWKAVKIRYRFLLLVFICSMESLTSTHLFVSNS